MEVREGEGVVVEDRDREEAEEGVPLGVGVPLPFAREALGVVVGQGEEDFTEGGVAVRGEEGEETGLRLPPPPPRLGLPLEDRLGESVGVVVEEWEGVGGEEGEPPPPFPPPPEGLGNRVAVGEREGSKGVAVGVLFPGVGVGDIFEDLEGEEVREVFEVGREEGVARMAGEGVEKLNGEGVA